MPGGAAAYAGLLAARLGYSTAALTSFGDDFLFASTFSGLNIHRIPAPHTTVFENIYANGQRTQFIHEKAAQLTPEQLPANWREAKTVLLGPICDEIDDTFLNFFDANQTTLCACPQGWMRQWDDRGKVSAKLIQNWEVLAKAAIISMSENDVNHDWGLIEEIAALSRLLVVTQGDKGATVFHEGVRHHFPACAAIEVDPTGAGDIFAAAFSLYFSQHKNIGTAAVFAHTAAAISIEKKGLEGIPAWGEVIRRMEMGRGSGVV